MLFRSEKLQLQSLELEAGSHEGEPEPGCSLTIGEIMAGANKHAATDKTKDQEEGNKGHGGNGQNQNQNQNQNQGSKKRPYGDSSDLVANTNTGVRRKDNNSQGYQGRTPTTEEVLSSPCPKHAKNGRCGHTLGQCVDLQRARFTDRKSVV